MAGPAAPVRYISAFPEPDWADDSSASPAAALPEHRAKEASQAARPCPDAAERWVWRRAVRRDSASRAGAEDCPHWRFPRFRAQSSRRVRWAAREPDPVWASEYWERPPMRPERYAARRATAELSAIPQDPRGEAGGDPKGSVLAWAPAPAWPESRIPGPAWAGRARQAERARATRRWALSRRDQPNEKVQGNEKRDARPAPDERRSNPIRRAADAADARGAAGPADPRGFPWAVPRQRARNRFSSRSLQPVRVV
jgi:hypothetical protein